MLTRPSPWERRNGLTLKSFFSSNDLWIVNSHEQSLRVLALLAIVLALALVMVICHLGVNSTLACGFAGAVFLHLGTRANQSQIGSAMVLGVGYGLLYKLLGAPFGGDPISTITSIGAFAGLGSITILAYQALWFKSEPEVHAFEDAWVLPLFLAAVSIAASLTQNFWPKTFDLSLYAFDCSLGVSPAPVVIGWWKAMPLLATVSTWTYALLLMFPPLYRAWAVHCGIGREPSVLRSFVIAGLLGIFLQQCCPATGPLHLFPQDFPDHLPSLSELSIGMTAVAGPRNAIPSMQATWALLVWWSAWRLNWWARIVATLFLVLTLLSALGSGDHYVVDLVVAVPFTLGVEGLCRRRGYAAAGLGFGLTLGWFILLRSGFRLPAPGLGWLLVAGTILTCVVFQIPLYRGQHTEEGQALSSRLSAMTGARLASRTR